MNTRLQGVFLVERQTTTLCILVFDKCACLCFSVRIQSEILALITTKKDYI